MKKIRQKTKSERDTFGLAKSNRRVLLEVRAKARVALKNPTGPPNIVIAFMKAADRRECDSHRAGFDGREFIRASNETLEQFHARVAREFPAKGGVFCVFQPDAKTEERLEK